MLQLNSLRPFGPCAVIQKFNMYSFFFITKKVNIIDDMKKTEYNYVIKNFMGG